MSKHPKQEDEDEKGVPGRFDGYVPDEWLNIYRIPRTIFLLFFRPAELAALVLKKRWDTVSSPITFFGISIAAAEIAIRLSNIFLKHQLVFQDRTWRQTLSGLLLLPIFVIPFIAAFHGALRFLSHPDIKISTTIASWCYLGGLMLFLMQLGPGLMLLLDSALSGYRISQPWTRYWEPAFLVAYVIFGIRLFARIHNNFFNAMLGDDCGMITIGSLLIGGSTLTLASKVFGIG